MGVQKSLQGLDAENDWQCPECKSKEIIKSKGEIYCKKCGYVLE